MLKFALLAGAMTIAAPAVAQTAPAQAQTAPSGSVASDPAATTSAPAQATPATDPAAASADQSAATTQPASGDQVAQIVDKEFPTYDKSGKGSLTKAEFGQWMVALKSASDPTAKADTKQTKAWVDAAFAQADTDKNKSVSKAELTGFLTKAQS